MAEEQDQVTVPKDSVTSRDENGEVVYDFVCPHESGCGVPGGESFTSSGWHTKKDATERGRQHLAEHAGQGIMQELHEFRVERGYAR